LQWELDRKRPLDRMTWFYRKEILVVSRPLKKGKRGNRGRIKKEETVPTGRKKP